MEAAWKPQPPPADPQTPRAVTEKAAGGLKNLQPARKGLTPHGNGKEGVAGSSPAPGLVYLPVAAL
jgi:hypothetical protein